MSKSAVQQSAAVLAFAAGLAVAPAAHAETPVHPDHDVMIDRVVMPATRASLQMGAVDGPIGFGTRGDAPVPAFVFTGGDPEGDAPSDVVFTDDGETIIVAHRESGNLILWDADTRAFVGSVDVSGLAQSVDVTPDGSRAVVACIDTGLASIVDLGTLTEIATVPVGQVPGSVSVSPDGALAAVHAAFDGTTIIIDIATASVVRTIPGIDTWSRLSFSFEAPAQSVQYGGPQFIDNTRLINVDLGADEIQFIDATTGAVNRVAVADSPFRVGVSLDGATAVVAHSGSSRTLTVFDIATETVSSTIPTAFDLSGPVAVNADGTKAAVAVQNAARVIDLQTGSSGFQLDTASLNDMVSNFDGTRAVGIGFRGPVIDFASGLLLGNANQAVSCEIGAASPADDRTAMCSTTFGDDLVVIGTDSTPSLEAYQLSGPDVEGDRCRTIAVSADGSVAVAVSIFSDTASIIDTATGRSPGRRRSGSGPAVWRSLQTGRRRWSRTSIRRSRA
jgi:DNA-binding beta-propeller fold protein YncE